MIDLVRAKSGTLHNICTLFKQNIKSCNAKGSEKRATKNMQLVLQHCCKRSCEATLARFTTLIKPQAPQAHVTSVLINVLNTEPVSRYKQPFRLCMRNEILRSANAKHHYSYLFFYKINKGDLPLDVFLCFLVWNHRFSRVFLADIVWDQSLSETQIFENKLWFSTK